MRKRLFGLDIAVEERVYNACSFGSASFADSSSVIAVYNGVGYEEVRFGACCQGDSTTIEFVTRYLRIIEVARVIYNGVVIEFTDAKTHATSGAVTIVISEEGVEARTFVKEHTAGKYLSRNTSATLSGYIIEYEAALNRRGSAIAEYTATFLTIACRNVIDNDTVQQVSALVHVHARTAAMTHRFIVQESMADGKAVPVRLLILYIMGVLILSKRSRFTFIFGFCPHTVSMRQGIFVK